MRQLAANCTPPGQSALNEMRGETGLGLSVVLVCEWKEQEDERERSTAHFLYRLLFSEVLIGNFF
jgi:hypothetical protein